MAAQRVADAWWLCRQCGCGHRRRSLRAEQASGRWHANGRHVERQRATWPAGHAQGRTASAAPRTPATYMHGAPVTPSSPSASQYVSHARVFSWLNGLGLAHSHTTLPVPEPERTIMLRRVRFALARDGDVPRQRRYPLVRDIDLPAVGLRCALPQLRAARTRRV